MPSTTANRFRPGAAVEYVGPERLSCEDHRNRSYLITPGLVGVVRRSKAFRGTFEYLVEWTGTHKGRTVKFLEWHLACAVQAA